MDVSTYSAISTAELVALRTLDDSEVEAILQKSPSFLARISNAMSRVMYVDELRYSIRIDTTDLIECGNRDALETYLLCTCIDTLAGKNDYVELQAWLRTGKVNIPGIQNRRSYIEEKQPALSNENFSSILSTILAFYNEHFGINQNILKLVQGLPPETKAELVKAYSIYQEPDPNGEMSWQPLKVDQKLKRIFVDYLFVYRRNRYTHESDHFPNFGGICAMRESFREGMIVLPLAETHQFPAKKGSLVVTCHYGDEALFLREVIFSCLAVRLGVMRPGWNDLYRKAEQQKRLLYALWYELVHNIQVMQAYFHVLSEPLLLRNHKMDGSPKFECRIAQGMLDGSIGDSLPIYKSSIQGYIAAISLFNTEIDSTGGNFRHNLEVPSQSITDLLSKSEVRWRVQELSMQCERLLSTFPVWTSLSKYYQPDI